MRWTIFSTAMVLATPVLAASVVQATTERPSFADNPTAYMMGFESPRTQLSVEGDAICISGNIPVKASAINVHINSQQPANQSAVTELLLEIFQSNSTIVKQLVGRKNPVSGTYNIYSQLCFPKATGTINTTTIQFLIHGAGFDRDYWSVAPGYSYIDYAARQGYTTFTYDRLGTGLSDHPDPLQVVQTAIQVEIAHVLIQLLRGGGISGHTFNNIVGVGHSFGSFQTLSITSKYSKDLDAAVLTGFSVDMTGMPVAFAGVGLAIASQSEPLRLSNLSNGYLTSDSIIGTQFFFFREPGFDPKLLKLAELTKQTITVGEFLTSNAVVATNFTGPIDVVNGENDLPNCHGNCLLPYNKAAAVKDMFYPAASNGSSWYLGHGAGHGLNLHYASTMAYEHIHSFIRKNGF
jgi:pimeloyl-ACP methyl ester carboxylesterase